MAASKLDTKYMIIRCGLNYSSFLSCQNHMFGRDEIRKTAGGVLGTTK